jgi:hypothetical protein
MEKRSILQEQVARLRALRWGREALLAAILTIAALVFIAAAFVATDSSDQGKTASETARTPQR